MSDEAIVFYAKKFFPWMLPRHGEALVRELIGIYLGRKS